MLKSWRWFGHKDRITLDMLRQIGVEGVVTALHHIPNGEVWNTQEIVALKKEIESHSMQWSVVESLPVSEEIKYGGENRDKLIENYKVSLANLGKAGIKTVCYNFMPVLDWIRTDLNYRNQNGTYTLFFDKIRFAYFDIHIIGRKGAEKDYSPAELEKVAKLGNTITQAEKDDLINTIIVKTQGFVNGNDDVDVFRNLLELYSGITKDMLRENLKYFLERVIPTAHDAGVNLCIHPDDPPFSVLGLPRIVTSSEDIEWILNAVDCKENGLTFCAGSLSAGLHNDVPELAKKFASRTHFAHLRSTQAYQDGNFMEAAHLEGRANLIEVVKTFLEEGKRSGVVIPMRVDHGPLMLDDIQSEGFNPGYSFLGRMKALAEMDGVMTTLKNLK